LKGKNERKLSFSLQRSPGVLTARKISLPTKTSKKKKENPQKQPKKPFCTS